MTDNEIIKALECCGKPVNEECCSECPYHLGDEEICHKLLGDTIDLINRQQAEIERLSKKNEELAEILSDTIRIRYAEAKTEAIKEFAKKLRQKIAVMVCSPDLLTLDDYDQCIDDVLKEMEE